MPERAEVDTGEFDEDAQADDELGALFVHPMEEEFARLLDFYHIPWLYEPTSFALNWSGDQVIVLTWLDRAHRDVLRTRPRDDPANPEVGVFSTRSPDRPNPIGLHVVEVLSTDRGRLQVRNLEALDGTPVIDLKPVLPGVPDG